MAAVVHAMVSWLKLESGLGGNGVQRERQRAAVQRVDQRFAERARRVLRPDDAVIVLAPGARPPQGIAAEWVAGRDAKGGRATAYLCRGTSCSLPVHVPSELVADRVPGA